MAYTYSVETPLDIEHISVSNSIQVQPWQTFTQKCQLYWQHTLC